MMMQQKRLGVVMVDADRIILGFLFFSQENLSDCIGAFIVRILILDVKQIALIKRPEHSGTEGRTVLMIAERESGRHRHKISFRLRRVTS
jgi:hypothetical protein